LLPSLIPLASSKLTIILDIVTAFFVAEGALEIEAFKRAPV